MNDIILAAASLILGGVISYWISLRQSPTKSMHYFVKDFDLISKPRLGIGNELELKFLDRPIERLRLCRVIVWNSGNVCIQRTDIAKSDPVSLTAPAANTVSVISIFQSRAAISVQCQADKSNISIEFDLLDENDWFEFRFIYDSAEADSKVVGQVPKIDGSIAAIPNGIRYLDLEDYLKESHWSGKLLASAMIVWPILMLVMVYVAFQVESIVKKLTRPTSWIDTAMPYFMSVLAVSISFAALIYLYSRWRVTKVVVPKAIAKALTK